MNTMDAIRDLAMWENWQSLVDLCGDQYAKSPIFVEQMSQAEEEFDQVADWIAGWSHQPFDPDGRTRDIPHGARQVSTKAFGPVTRQWLDTNTELWFLEQNGMLKGDAIDIGAGYGRLAVSAAPFFSTYTCTDAVPAAQKACRMYVRQYSKSANAVVLTPEELAFNRFPADLAINIHSWNECSLASIEGWLELLNHLNVPYLFTVSHGQLSNNTAYLCHQSGQPSFLPVLKDKYELVDERTLGLSKHPYALWKAKKVQSH